MKNKFSSQKEAKPLSKRFSLLIKIDGQLDDWQDIVGGDLFSETKPQNKIEAENIFEGGIRCPTPIEGVGHLPHFITYAQAAENNQSKYFSFLLRIDSDKTAYQAKIAPPETGDYPLTIGILDVKNQVSKKVFGTLKVQEGKEKIQIAAPSFLTTRFLFASFVFLVLILIVIIGLIWLIVNRKRFSLFR